MTEEAWNYLPPIQKLNISACFIYRDISFLFYVTLTDCGRVLACGSNAFGQLGDGQTVTHSEDPLVVEVRT